VLSHVSDADPNYRLTGEEAFTFPDSVETEKLNIMAGTPKLIMAVMLRVLSLEKMDGTHISVNGTCFIL
jgi:hypothetical protein